METISSEDLMENFTALPPEAQKEALHFIEFLRSRYLPAKTSAADKTNSLEDEPFIGIWKGREDMQDSSEWVRDLRQQDWS
ncbi:MAG: DUF2281 domain-containing protein [Thiolinea sp.]